MLLNNNNNYQMNLITNNNTKEESLNDDEEEEQDNFNNNNNQYDNNNNLNENKNDTNMFDMIFLPKYHSTMANMVRLIKQDITEDGKIIKLYENNKKEIIFPNSGLRKEIYPDGYQISYFKNKDIKQIYPDGKDVYLYAKNNTVVTKFPNGLKVFKFSNGQIEKNFIGWNKNN